MSAHQYGIAVGGFYQHVKGGIYRVLSLANSAEDPEKQFVLYEDTQTLARWVRPYEEFVGAHASGAPRFSLLSGVDLTQEDTPRLLVLFDQLIGHAGGSLTQDARLLAARVRHDLEELIEQHEDARGEIEDLYGELGPEYDDDEAAT